MLSAGLDHKNAPSLVPTESAEAKVHVADLATEKAEAIFIAHTIEGLMGGMDSLSLYAGKVAGHEGPVCGSFGDIAILFRLKALAPAIEQALVHQGIPYQTVGQADRLRDRQGRTLLAVLRWLKDPADRMAYEQIEGEVKGMPDDVGQQVERYWQERNKKGCTVRDWVEGLKEFQWLPLEEEAWKEAWESLLRASFSFGNDLGAFLRSLVLSQDTDFLERKTERVTLATLHAAKGLEFPVVFIAGCEHLLVPCRVGARETDLEEERRLFYVGMTRACRLLYLTWAGSRFLYGERRSSAPSRFLEDVPEKRVTRVRQGKKEGKKKPPKDRQLSLF
jgi:DNA helicase-2/ATP-dependent DNA helicase PcrA